MRKKKLNISIYQNKPRLKEEKQQRNTKHGLTDSLTSHDKQSPLIPEGRGTQVRTIKCRTDNEIQVKITGRQKSGKTTNRK